MDISYLAAMFTIHDEAPLTSLGEEELIAADVCTLPCLARFHVFSLPLPDKYVYLLSPLVDPGEVFAWVKDNGDTFDEGRTNLMRGLFRQIMEGLKVFKALFVDGMNGSVKAE